MSEYEAVAYVYMNVGADAQPTEDATEYVYMNVLPNPGFDSTGHVPFVPRES